MRNQIRNLFNSTPSIVALLIIVCCLLLTALPMKIYGDWTGLSVAGALVGGLVLFVWLVWCTYILCTKKTLSEMPPKPRMGLETVSYALTLWWVYIVTESIMIVILWACLYGWYLLSEWRGVMRRE